MLITKTKQRMNSDATTVQLSDPLHNAAEFERPIELIVAQPTHDFEAIERLFRLNADFEERFRDKLRIEPALSRPLVSFQANKNRAVYRWYKYKEAFSAGMVEYFLENFNLKKGKLLDPFAGSGTAMFAASGLGMQAEGIELLPIGQQIIETKQLIDLEITSEDIVILEHWAKVRPWTKSKATLPINELRITRGAYPTETLEGIGKYLAAVENENKHVRSALRFALLCILESISYTRKDGQYLRWDHRSGRTLGKKIFDKGKILSFNEAISEKLNNIVSDLRAGTVPEDLFAKSRTKPGKIIPHIGSCLDILPTFDSAKYDCIITSPPYCNRYDYTRTYALELALLGVSEDELVKLRQDMLSCTVENRAKNLLKINPKWDKAIRAADQQKLLQEILKYLDTERDQGRLNNNGISRMVRGYFYEMACVIAECARVLKRNARLIMVNDNVRYAGVSVSVDIILSDIAQQLGFEVENILVLPNGKGNSSQQMGVHGRESLRKCVYVWQKK
ncbi:MAG: site-specific DNA-methyltransferase [Verrucomicrobiota bacterium]|jgi:DNA modification methylase